MGGTERREKVLMSRLAQAGAFFTQQLGGFVSILVFSAETNNDHLQSGYGTAYIALSCVGLVGLIFIIGVLQAKKVFCDSTESSTIETWVFWVSLVVIAAFFLVADILLGLKAASEAATYDDWFADAPAPRRAPSQ